MMLLNSLFDELLCQSRYGFFYARADRAFINVKADTAFFNVRAYAAFFNRQGCSRSLVRSWTHLYLLKRCMTQGILPTSSRQVQA